MINNPELGTRVVVAGIQTNCHDLGRGQPVFLVHGSGPGVSAYANWRLTMPALSKHFRVIAPDANANSWRGLPPHLERIS